MTFIWTPDHDKMLARIREVGANEAMKGWGDREQAFVLVKEVRESLGEETPDWWLVGESTGNQGDAK